MRVRVCERATRSAPLEIGASHAEHSRETERARRSPLSPQRVTPVRAACALTPVVSRCPSRVVFSPRPGRLSPLRLWRPYIDCCSIISYIYSRVPGGACCMCAADAVSCVRVRRAPPGRGPRESRESETDATADSERESLHLTPPPAAQHAPSHIPPTRRTVPPPPAQSAAPARGGVP